MKVHDFWDGFEEGKSGSVLRYQIWWCKTRHDWFPRIPTLHYSILHLWKQINLYCIVFRLKSSRRFFIEWPILKSFLTWSQGKGNCFLTWKNRIFTSHHLCAWMATNKNLLSEMSRIDYNYWVVSSPTVLHTEVPDFDPLLPSLWMRFQFLHDLCRNISTGVKNFEIA